MFIDLNIIIKSIKIFTILLTRKQMIQHKFNALVCTNGSQRYSSKNGKWCTVQYIHIERCEMATHSTIHFAHLLHRNATYFFCLSFFLNKKKKHIPQFCKSHCCAVFLACDSKHRSPDDVISKKMSGHAS